MAEMMQALDPIMIQMEVNSPLRDRRIFLNDDVSDSSIFKTMYWLDRLISIDKKSGTKDDIEIVISTQGGGAYECVALCSKMESMIKSGYNIITTCSTIAFSAGFWILSSGSHRRAYYDSRIMLHAGNGGFIGNHQDMQENLEEFDAIWLRMKDKVVKRTKITEEKLNEIKKNKFNWYMWGNEALELGVIDEIL